MPTISSFYGILVRMFFNDHDPPHIHARYGEFEATIEIESLRVLKGELPGRALNLVSEWAATAQNRVARKLASLPREEVASEGRAVGLRRR